MSEFTTTLAGAKHRQAEILKATRWMTEGPVTLYLEPEPDNPHDPNAVRVDAEQDGKPRTRIKIGYLPARIAEDVHDEVEDFKVTAVDVCMPDDRFDFWNLRFTFVRQNSATERKVVHATVPHIPDDPDDKPIIVPEKYFPKARDPSRIFWGVAIALASIIALSLALEQGQKEPPKLGLTPTEVRERATSPGDGKVGVTLLKTSNIRRGPGTDHQVVRVINEGEHYRCFPAEPDAEWVKCYEGQYIYRPLLKFDPPTE